MKRLLLVSLLALTFAATAQGGTVVIVGHDSFSDGGGNSGCVDWYDQGTYTSFHWDPGGLWRCSYVAGHVNPWGHPYRWVRQ